LESQYCFVEIDYSQHLLILQGLSRGTKNKTEDNK